MSYLDDVRAIVREVPWDKPYPRLEYNWGDFVPLTVARIQQALVEWKTEGRLPAEHQEELVVRQRWLDQAATFTAEDWTLAGKPFQDYPALPIEVAQFAAFKMARARFSDEGLIPLAFVPADLHATAIELERRAKVLLFVRDWFTSALRRIYGNASRSSNKDVRYKLI